MFEKFLIDQNLLGRFCRAMRDQGDDNPEQWIRDRDTHSPSIAITFAIYWSATESDGEGWDFWSDVHKKWLEFIHENGIKPNRSIPRDDVDDSLNRKTLKEIQDGNDYA